MRTAEAESDPLLKSLPLVRNHVSRSLVEILGVTATAPAVIAGPCAIESAEMLESIASELSRMGIGALRGGSFKHRTLPTSFAGLREGGLKIHAQVARQYGMTAVSEILDPRHLPMFAEYIDIIQIGARNMRNYELLHAVAKAGKPVILKRDFSATLYEWLAAAEHLLAHGARDIVLCERGVRWHDPSFRNLLDVGAIAWVASKTAFPIVADPSHACGRSDLVTPLGLAALAAGAQGLMVEVHPDLAAARCDAEQGLDTAVFRRLLALARHVRPEGGGS